MSSTIERPNWPASISADFEANPVQPLCRDPAVVGQRPGAGLGDPAAAGRAHRLPPPRA